LKPKVVGIAPTSAFMVERITAVETR
jgi:hypothetical protein